MNSLASDSGKDPKDQGDWASHTISVLLLSFCDFLFCYLIGVLLAQLISMHFMFFAFSPGLMQFSYKVYFMNRAEKQGRSQVHKALKASCLLTFFLNSTCCGSASFLWTPGF